MIDFLKLPIPKRIAYSALDGSPAEVTKIEADFEASDCEDVMLSDLIRIAVHSVFDEAGEEGDYLLRPPINWTIDTQSILKDDDGDNFLRLNIIHAKKAW